jgi:F-type H+-transporting ATPase subunit delta
MVTEKKRIALLPAIIDVFHRLVLAYRNTVEGELVSAVALNETQVEKIKTNIETMIGKSVLLKEDIDTSIIGGFVVRVEDLVIDNSIRYQLEKLREKLVAE